MSRNADLRIKVKLDFKSALEEQKRYPRRLDFPEGNSRAIKRSVMPVCRGQLKILMNLHE